MKKLILLFVAITMIASYTLTAQGVSINTDGSSADGSAMLDIESTDKGLLIPRMTQSEIEVIASPADGLAVYNTDDKRFYFFDGGANEWKEIAIGAGTITPFICGTSTITDSDGNTYNTVLIGSQCWMAENLATTKYNNSTYIPHVTDNTEWGNLTSPGYCWYNNNQATGNTYGALYNWYTVNTGILCPTGWHIPTDDEWKTMEMYLGMTQSQADASGWRGTDEGGKLKETGTTHWTSPNTGATNSSGFTGLPGGCRSTNGSFYDLTYDAYFWSSSEDGSGAWRRHLHYSYAQVHRSPDAQAYGFSVRCLRD